MAIECYYRWCPHHGVNTESGPYGGPFCHESECKADNRQLVRYENLRKEELRAIDERENLMKQLRGEADV